MIEYAFDLTDKQSKELESMLIKIGLYPPSTANPFKFSYKYYYVKYTEYSKILLNPSERVENLYKSIQLHYYGGLGKTQIFNIDNTWSGINNFNSILELITPLIREHKINTLINE